MKTTSIAFAEDDIYWHNEILFALKNNPKFKVLFHVWNGNDLLAYLKKHKPEILIVDFFMPVLCGNEAIFIIKRELPEIKILGISVNYQQGLINDLKNSGMEGFEKKKQGIKEILSAIEVIKKGGYSYNTFEETDLYIKETDNHLHDYKFTSIEITILRKCAEGKSSKVIGLELSRSSRTIEGHLYDIKQRLNVSKVGEAITKTISLGIIPTPSIVKPRI